MRVEESGAKRRNYLCPDLYVETIVTERGFIGSGDFYMDGAEDDGDFVDAY